MALSKKTYVDGVTVITADNLNAIQDEIINNASNINNKQNKTDNTLSTTNKTVVGAINELFSSVSNGKASVASAITDKGVNTSQGATFEQMATNIRAIQTGSTGITPSGTYNITRNGTYDVTNYASANVNVPTSSGGITPTGNKAITASTTTQTNIDVTNYATVSVAPTPTETKTITENGTYTPSSGKYFSSVTVNVPTSGGGSDTIGTATVTPAYNATTVTISDLKGTPKWFIFYPNTSVAGASNIKRITSHVYNGTSDFGQAINGSVSGWTTSYSVATNTTNFSHSYNNGSLTLNGGGATAGGYYYNVASTLIYGY